MVHPRFYTATDKLIKAFITGQITHGGACSCAVGNMCGSGDWAFIAIHSSQESSQLLANGKRLIESTGYNAYEIFEIEKRFEGRKISALSVNTYMGTGSSLDHKNDPDGFKGLSAVFDYLIQLEDWSEEEKKVNLAEMCLA